MLSALEKLYSTILKVRVRNKKSRRFEGQPSIFLSEIMLMIAPLTARVNNLHAVSYNGLMTKYAAMIRGVGPENPNMRGEKLRWAFEQMGFTKVQPFLTSGNVVFESDETDAPKLEKQVEAALPHLLNFSRDVFVRSQADLQKLVSANPFANLTHQNAGKTYLTATFFKIPPKLNFKLPYQPEGKAFKVVAEINGTLCNIVDTTTGKTPDLMNWLERQFGKQITTRTWLTITRLLEKIKTPT